MTKKNFLHYGVSQVPTLTVIGVQTLLHTFLDAADKSVTVTLGELRKLRGKGIPYDAFVVGDKGAMIPVTGEFGTKAQASHAIHKAFYAEERAAKIAARETAAQAAIDARAARVAAKVAKAAKAAGDDVSAPADVIDPEQAKRDEKNRKRREKRAADKAAA